MSSSHSTLTFCGNSLLKLRPRRSTTALTQGQYTEKSRSLMSSRVDRSSRTQVRNWPRLSRGSIKKLSYRLYLSFSFWSMLSRRVNSARHPAWKLLSRGLPRGRNKAYHPCDEV